MEPKGVKVLELHKTIFTDKAYFSSVFDASSACWVKSAPEFQHRFSLIGLTDQIWNNFWKKCIQSIGVDAPCMYDFSSLNSFSGVNFSAKIRSEPIHEIVISVNDRQSTGVERSFPIGSRRVYFDREAAFTINNASQIGQLSNGPFHSVLLCTRTSVPYSAFNVHRKRLRRVDTER